SCPHSAQGGATTGSGDVFINGLPALRVGDAGEHAGCCGSNTWKAKTGAPSVFFNGRPAHRKGDAVRHCGGNGSLCEGSPDVFIGDVVAAPGGEQGGDAIAALIAAGATFAFVAPTTAIGAVLGEAAPWLAFKGLPAGIFKLLGKAMPR